MAHSKRAFAVLMNFILVLTANSIVASPQAGAQSASTQTSEGEYALLTPDELDGLVSPIALYPDELVAQVLGAATFPYEVVDAVETCDTSIGNNLNDLRDFINAQPASTMVGVAYMSNATVPMAQNLTVDHALA